MTGLLPNVFFVGDYKVERLLNQITIGDAVIVLEPQVMALLCYFASHADEVLSRQQIMADVWSSQVSEGAINRVVGILRKVLADNVEAPEYIQTVAKKGYRFIAPVRFESTKAHATMKNQGLILAGRSLNAKWLLWLSSGVLLLFALLFWRESRHGEAIRIDAPVFEPLTSIPGFEYDASLSHDEQWLVYRHRQNSTAPYHLYLKKLATQQTIQLTFSAFDDRAPSFSHDKSKVVFFRKGNGKCQLDILHLDSQARPINTETVYQCGAVEHYSNVQWAPDGQSLYFTDRENSAQPYQIYRLNLNTSKLDEVTAKEDNYYGDNELALSPSGKQLLFLRNKYWGNNQVFVKNLETGDEKRIAELGFLTWNPSWTADEGSIVFSDNRIGGKLKLLNVATGEITMLYQSPQAIHYPELNATNNQIIYATQSASVDLWQQDISVNTLPNEQTTKLKINSSQLDEQPVYSKDGQSLLFLSKRSGVMQLWLHTQNELKAISSLPSGIQIDSYAWSPSGSQILVALSDKRLYLVDISKDTAQKVPLGDVSAAFASFSHDGTAFYFSSDMSGDWQLWRYEIDSGAMRQITDKGGYQSIDTASHNQIFFTKYRKPGIWQLDISTKAERLLIPDANRGDNFTVCSDDIYYLTHNQTTDLWRYNLKSGEKVQLKDMPTTARLKFDLKNNCKTLVYSFWDNVESDIVKMKFSG
ncbi:winged helix-turn-helix domain-containing protein [Pseudoalteromonas sp. S16_S37]|uniref:winged helix-turn-helix domain-containing protein n=1 Tax=Pseudoalteromonas sp. S16_S37 TaxID=2720228 RepID=UPI0016819AFC|nr:winged helix-turn-helix domain-containing protein [Pseudoalteromonas sp. S16_S37]MBD1584258.1 DUF5050 domain-containing protein [Pseudoalteromonas sp. S16_S37]